MDLIKIGKFISQKRKEKNITQSELAEMLYISDRAISKWENGVCLPDAGNMPKLCEILNITINDLFSGEVVDMKKNEMKLEENLLEMTRMKEESDKRLLSLETIIGYIISILFLILIFTASYVDMTNTARIIIITSGLIAFFITALVLVKIEQVAGYYECQKCHHKYVPSYKSVNLSAHFGRTRYMKCPKCNEKSWQRKVIKKD